MFSMFSAVSGHFTRGLVLGTVLPVLLFTASMVPVTLLFSPGGAAGGARAWELITGQATMLSILVVAASGLLYNLNTPIIRFYEGYPWHRSRLGRRRINAHKLRLRNAFELQESLIALRSQITDAPARSSVQSSLNEVSRVIASEYPGEDLVLPTRLGNVIRNAEEYPRHQYGMSAIPLWPRLVAVIGKEYGAAIDETKASLDFFLNCSLLAAMLAALIAVLSVSSGLAVRDARVAAGCAALGLAATAIAYAAYVATVGAAAAWGAQVKGAFDLYRGELLKQLGYQYQIVTRQEERNVWRAVSRQVIFGDPLDGTPLPYAPLGARSTGRLERVLDLIWPEQ